MDVADETVARSHQRFYTNFTVSWEDFPLGGRELHGLDVAEFYENIRSSQLRVWISSERLVIPGFCLAVFPDLLCLEFPLSKLKYGLTTISLCIYIKIF